MKTIDERLPKTTTYWVEEGILIIKHVNFMITLEENKAITDLIATAMDNDSIKGIVINNRDARGAWPQEILKASAEDSLSSKMVYTKKIATLTNSKVTTSQMNRHIRMGGREKWAKAFDCDFNEEVKSFLLS